jgi:glycolate oxidase FAD binding subunit
MISTATQTAGSASNSASNAAALADFIERIDYATAHHQPLCLQGGGSKQWYGEAPKGDILDTRTYTGIIDYDPTELVITARCGTPLSVIVAALAEQGQMLPFEPPSFTNQATIGGVVAAGLAGPRRAYTGAVRDFLLGTVLLSGRAERLVFGGQVMKNVAGYDVSRLLAGSMGCLGLLLEMSVKVLPLPRSEISLLFSYSRQEALTHLNQWAGLPYPISASCWEDGHLILRLSGSEAAIKSTRHQLGGELLSPVQASEYWSSLREQTHPFFNQDGTLWRLSVPDTTPAFSLSSLDSDNELIEWGGAQRWFRLPEANHPQQQTQPNSETIRALATRMGGHATLFRCRNNTLSEVNKPTGIFHPLTPPLLAIHRRLKQTFDPAGIFNPGRMYLELDGETVAEHTSKVNA